MSEILAQLPLARPVLDALGERVGVLGDLFNPAPNRWKTRTVRKCCRVHTHRPNDASYANSLNTAFDLVNNLARASSHRAIGRPETHFAYRTSLDLTTWALPPTCPKPILHRSSWAASRFGQQQLLAYQLPLCDGPLLRQPCRNR